MDNVDSETVYFELIVDASDDDTDIWLGDDSGHFVQKGVGLLCTNLLPGNYTVEFGLGTNCYPVKLVQDMKLTQTKLMVGPTCPRPTPKI